MTHSMNNISEDISMNSKKLEELEKKKKKKKKKKKLDRI